MKERPILFSAPMVRSILANTKWQTRRVMKNPPVWSTEYQPAGWFWNGTHPGEPTLSKWPDAGAIGQEIAKHAVCPYGWPGDRLWVRETHAPQPDCLLSWDRWMKGHGGEKPIVHYAADASDRAWVDKWRPSIHMPRWASRITLEVTGVRVERLQDISEADAMAEGIVRQSDGGFGLADSSHYHYTDPRISYWSLWEAINGEGSVDANPWAWVVEFKRLEQPQ
jgi:hypothetical protein